MIHALRYSIALVWLVFGFGAKVLGLVPRHEAILARALSRSRAPFLQALGAQHSRTLIVGVGLCETLMGVWMASGFATMACAALQTVVVVTMNTIEIAVARDLLLFPMRMVLLNLGLLSAAWYVALAHTN